MKGGCLGGSPGPLLVSEGEVLDTCAQRRGGLGSECAGPV